ncbi:hypothetical protein DQ04_01181140 [Trypanosoma grayi]|uniref:hypothetical protein n=1 Tax=Trypanosoma grayi TaxID=71804 RepID=UPI0004F40FF2|nr:hypothetical protein DQ04_01181140 [Trypanosoma grayi]KEG13160.1 hypothetical protein DQ04_01181140 [Trypanosoma grayi]
MSSWLSAEETRTGTWGWQQCVARIESLRRSSGELIGYCDVRCEKGHRVDGNVWYADRYLYPNHWQPGSKVQPKLVDDGEPQSWFNAWATATLMRLGLLLMVIVLLLVFI